MSTAIASNLSSGLERAWYLHVLRGNDGHRPEGVAGRVDRREQASSRGAIPKSIER